AVDVGTLKGVQSGTIRILVWVLSFLSFGYATEEFEVTDERLGVYRPEEHIDNPKDYADNADARRYDQRLRPPVELIELQLDPDTGMKNYIANESLDIATSAGYVKHSFSRSIHFGRVYTNGASGTRGRDADLYEALRCLGQGLHCLEDFGAHTNYTELSLRELGFTNVFPHTGTATEIYVRGHRVFPLVTGTFGAVDFLHSVLGEATDHFAQTEVNEMDKALGDAQVQSKNSDKARSFGGPSQQASYLTNLLSQVPGAGGLCQQAVQLQAQADAQEQHIFNTKNRDPFDKNHAGSSAFMEATPDPRASQPNFAGSPGTVGAPAGPGIPGMSPNFDPMKTAAQLYPIFVFRDKVVKVISATIEKIPGLEALVEKITETLTIFILSLLAPYIRPIINTVSAQLQAGSSTVVDASGKHQYEVWEDPNCSDPTHSLLSKDHFSNILNEPAGQVASAILQYVAPRVIYAWQHPDIPKDQVLDDVVRVFHHPAIRDPQCEIHRKMFDVVQRWVHSRPDQGANLNIILSADGVKSGRNHQGEGDQAHSHGATPSLGNIFGSGSHSKVKGAPWEDIQSSQNRSAGRQADVGMSGAAEEIATVYPGTRTGYDARLPPSSVETAYAPAQYQSNLNIQEAYSPGIPPSGQSYYDTSSSAQVQQSYQENPSAPPYDYQQQQNYPHQEYPPASYSFDTDAGLPEQGQYYDGRP
ncbi:hypothetical protein MMC12_007300, partial [Toensbergia leucococca]|nr:hypothetical protein [Toensbergia leucococca]